MKRRRFDTNDDLPDEPLINLTPLIDVVFVVLICFMLIAPVLDIDIVDLATGGAKKTASAPTEMAPLVIVVKADNSLWMRGQRMSTDELERALILQKQRNPKVIPQVVHDKNATFGTYQTVKNVLERCGFDQMDVVLKPNA